MAVLLLWRMVDAFALCRTSFGVSLSLYWRAVSHFGVGSNIGTWGNERRLVLCSWLSPFSKFPGTILFWCDVTAYVGKESSLLEKHSLWSEESLEKVESEAPVIGEVAVGKTKDGDYERKQLSIEGNIALILAEVLPECDGLKFLRSNSGFAMIAIAIQVLGYIIALVFRQVKHLPVAPLEVFEVYCCCALRFGGNAKRRRQRSY